MSQPQSARNTEANEFNACWALIEQALTDIHNRDAGKLSFEQLYRASYKIVLKKRGGELYERVSDFEQRWFDERVIPPIKDLLSNNNLISLAVGELPGTTANERRQMAEKFIKGLRDSWERHTQAMNMIADVLMYLDRGYATDTKRPSIYTTTIGLYRDHILLSLVETTTNQSRLIDVVNRVIIGLVNMERGEDLIDKNMIRRCLFMLEELYEMDDDPNAKKLYETQFEPFYLEKSQMFYAEEADKLKDQANASTWLRHTRKRLKEEEERCETTVSQQTTQKIIKVVEDSLIKKHLEAFLLLPGSGIKAMVDNDLFEDLTILYLLASRVEGGKEQLKNNMQKHVVALGLEIEKVLKETDFSAPQGAADGEEGAGAEKAKSQSPSNAAQQTAAAVKWVDDVLQLKGKFDRILSQCFNADPMLESALTRSFSDFINMFDRSSEYVSLFIDDNLKRGIRGKTEAEVDETLDRAITLIRYVQAKDMFERYYQKHLARRLLHGKSESQDAEKQMISRMKQEVGNHFTKKFEGMFTDMDTSRDLTSGYRTHIRDLGDVDRKNVDLGIHVLTKINWPQDVTSKSVQADDGSQIQCNFPQEIRHLQQSFLKYYLKERNGRVLTWNASAGTAEIKCVFPKVPGKETGPLSKERRYELTVSTHGMIILLLFNDLADGESLSYDEIQAKTNILPNELSRALASLSLAPKSRVLVKNPATKTVKSGDSFKFNNQFASKAVKIKAPIVNATSKVEDEDERKETEKKNDQTRSHVVDAAIVRIMKYVHPITSLIVPSILTILSLPSRQRKELAHNLLITEIVTQLAGRFKPELPLIKKQIEDLINREYLERAEVTSQPAYRYLA